MIFFGEIYSARLTLYDALGNNIWSDALYYNNTSEEIVFQKKFDLNRGTYYFSVTPHNGEGTYSFTINETPTIESFADEQTGSDNTSKEANSIIHGNDYTGFIAYNDSDDFYQFELASAGELTLNFLAGIYGVRLTLYDEEGSDIWSDAVYWNSTTERTDFKKNFFVNQGKYYFSVSNHNGGGEYSFKFLFASANETFPELQNGSNNKMSSANPIVINQKYNGLITDRDPVDFYRIDIADAKVSLNVLGELYSLRLTVYDANGNDVFCDNAYCNNVTEVIDFSKELELEKGVYYLAVDHNSGVGKYVFWFTNGGVILEPQLPEEVITVKVNGNRIAFDQQPVLEGGRTLVPLRAIFEALGADVEWNGNTQTVIATKSETQVSLQIGSADMYVNGKVKTLDVPAKLINGRTLVPVRAISEAFGCEVNWDGHTKTVFITK